jgi:hypothetical protein
MRYKYIIHARNNLDVIRAAATAALSLLLP